MAYLFDKGRFVTKTYNKPKEIYSLHEPIDFMNQKRIQIDTGSSSNFIQLARQDHKLHEMFKEILANDYILYFHQNTLSKFYKRSYVQELFQRKDLIRHKDTFYTLDEPANKKLNDEVPKKLLVIFTCMPDAKRYDSSLIPNRMFPKFFDGNEYTKYVICSENVELYYKQTDCIDASKIYKINLADKHIMSHPEVSRNSVPEQLTILNNFFATHI
ncbi:hypothetical protein BUZ84_11320 [Mammaliicoccus sciuri]|uniref:hypothetical protein n=1 Tax=Mammaliicoccus sciuri TaxID=1296 RepID=UPI000D1DA9FA|nr:hypothetical protein [Mammaliicoccus sciuri]PTJ79180.1 hypothetical protein BUZ84_11320 [Mammaliicoccus sciuri]